jgi:hypothetical protein
VASGSGHLVRRRVMLMAVIGPFHRFWRLRMIRIFGVWSMITTPGARAR